jgi:hypothetical protein
LKYLKDRVWKRIHGWLELLLLVGGEDVLIKLVVQAIPIFSMACFKLPRGLCHHINQLIHNFWWASKAGKKKTHWVSWEVMFHPKVQGIWAFVI